MKRVQSLVAQTLRERKTAPVAQATTTIVTVLVAMGIAATPAVLEVWWGGFLSTKSRKSP
tara:strand:- start:350 stop:529 length:180 start_codon:yes stop_codon:yes gene_type:complete